MEICENCNKTKVIHAKGKCLKCYNTLYHREYYKKNKKYLREYHRKKQNERCRKR